MNQPLSDTALRALKAAGFETHNGYCSRWCRQVTAALYGPDKYRDLWGASARISAQNFLNAGLGHYARATLKPQIGDILFKTIGSGGFGHVGILTPEGVAENSTVHWNRSGGKDARGLRTLAEFGAYHVIGILPAPATAPVSAPQPKCIWNGEAFDLAMVDGRPYGPFRELLEALGQEIYGINDQTSQTPPRFYINSRPK